MDDYMDTMHYCPDCGAQRWARHRHFCPAPLNIFDLHRQMTAHLFPAYSNTDERFLALGLAGEVGELCNMIKKRWRDGSSFEEEIRDEIADIRVYLELLAKCFGIEGEKLDARVKSKLEKVVKKHKARLAETGLEA